jgi:8-oxo-dGTP pyrophosphatase MutT (NUDIX family)
MKVPVIRLASTVMMLRPGAGCFEVFMLRRSARSAFAPDVYVFPGGTVDEADYETSQRIGGLNEERLARMYRAQPAPLLAEAEHASPSAADARALLVAALRETFEEAGVLLGMHSIERLELRALHEARAQLLADKATFEAVLEMLDLRLDASALELFSQWITPPSEGRRFNAHFFVARADAQHAIADRFETHDEIWISPQKALERHEAGSYAMVYPTIKHIERLARFERIEDVMDFSRSKSILRIMPNTLAEHGFTLPQELEYAW